MTSESSLLAGCVNFYTAVVEPSFTNVAADHIFVDIWQRADCAGHFDHHLPAFRPLPSEAGWISRIWREMLIFQKMYCVFTHLHSLVCGHLLTTIAIEAKVQCLQWQANQLPGPLEC